MKQPPIRNASWTGDMIYAHSGEYSPHSTDVIIPGRSLNFRFVRKYRSSQVTNIGLLGRGWFFNYDRRLQKSGNDITYQDGQGREFLFKKERSTKYISPSELYCELTQDKHLFIQKFRFGTDQVFESPEKGGKMIQIRDKNNNTLSFQYNDSAIILSDTFNRKIVLTLENKLITRLEDFTGRYWEYHYDKYQCLTDILQPATRDFPQGTTIRYEYDNQHRLISLVNARGQVYIKNSYDGQGRVIAQQYGLGIFQISYQESTKEPNKIKTTTILRNGGKLIQDHDKNGHEIKRVLFVNPDAVFSENIYSNTELVPEEILNYGLADITRGKSKAKSERHNTFESDENGYETRISNPDASRIKSPGKSHMVALITKSSYNKHGELINRTYPFGNRKKWTYSEDESNSKDRGNLLQEESVTSDNKHSLATAYEYNTEFQLRTSVTNPKGIRLEYKYDTIGNLIHKAYPPVAVQPINLKTLIDRPPVQIKKLHEEYEYNISGQLIRNRNTDGTIDEYYYFPEEDPIGTHEKNYNTPKRKGGFLAKMIKDAKGIKFTIAYTYDKYGNRTSIIDAKYNSIVQHFNAMGRIERVVGRAPYFNENNFHFDPDYNIIESIKAFEHYKYDNQRKDAIVKDSVYREISTYNLVGNLIQRQFTADSKEVTERFIRNENENIIRQISPTGDIIEFKYDERNLLIEKKSGLGTSQIVSYFYAYTLNGKPGRFTDATGNSWVYHYDGFHRSIGFTNPAGTTRKLHLNGNGHTEKIEYFGNPGSLNRNEKQPEYGLLDEIHYHLDEWDRVFRIDRKWMDSSESSSLRRSEWDNAPEMISKLIEYGDNGLPVTIWKENNNVLSVGYDGAERVIQINDTTGLTTYFEYDINNNIIKFKQTSSDKEFNVEVTNEYDELDRLIWQQKNHGSPQKWSYNALNQKISSISESGIEVKYMHDDLGRAAGHLYKIDNENNSNQMVKRLYEWDDNYHLIGFTNAENQKTTLRHDNNGRLTAQTFANGNTLFYQYDKNNRIGKMTTPDGEQVFSIYDSTGRLEKQIFLAGDEKQQKKERYNYDGRNRLIEASSESIVQYWQYDSLSRVIREQRGDKTVHYMYDSAGNIKSMTYPGGYTVIYEYDSARRITKVSDSKGEVIANYEYRSATQLNKIILSGSLQAVFNYDNQQRLQGIEYRWIDTQDLVDGCRYKYDDAGRIIHEIHLDEGINTGDRYFYDKANRLAKAQYQVTDVHDPNSSFDHETTFEYYPGGLWKRRAEYDGNRNLIKEEEGTLTSLNNYETLGNYFFRYDKNGNCTLKLSSESTQNNYTPIMLITTGAKWEYTYDERQRIIKAVQTNILGNVIMMVEYTYDNQSNIIKRVVTDENGLITTYEYVFALGVLIQEYTNGILTKQYLYGLLETIPIKIDKFQNGQKIEVLPTLNGRESITTWLDKNTRLVLQRLHVDGLGHSLPKEIGGIPIPSQGRSSRFKDMYDSNIFSLFGHDIGGSVMTDLLTEISSIRGNHFNTSNGHSANPFRFSKNPGWYSSGDGTSSGWTRTAGRALHWGAAGAWTLAGTMAVAGLAAGPGTPIVEGVALGIGAVGAGLWQAGDVIEWLGEELGSNTSTSTNGGGTSDGGTSDSGTSDGGTSDGGTSDSGTSDGGTSDGGTSDSGTSDEGTSNGGCDDTTTCCPQGSTYPNPDETGTGPITAKDLKLAVKNQQLKYWSNKTPGGPGNGNDQSFIQSDKKPRNSCEENDGCLQKIIINASPNRTLHDNIYGPDYGPDGPDVPIGIPPPDEHGSGGNESTPLP